jgi:thioredoxin reductase (NADPH)
LAEFASHITILARSDKYTAEEITQQKVKANPKITILPFRQSLEVMIENSKVAGMRVLNTQTNEEEIIPANGIFPYIGADPVTDFAKDLGITNAQGYLVVNEDMSTAIPGIYGAGDVCAKVLRQVVTATNDGAIAAQSALKYIRDNA